MIFWPLILTLYAGFVHAFETDHLLAVSAIVTRRKRTILAIKDGLYWGLGHTSTIFFVGVVFFVLRMQIGQELFRFFEAGVGLVLVTIGIYRIAKWYEAKDNSTHPKADTGNAMHTHNTPYKSRGRRKRGVLMLAVMANADTVGDSLVFLVLFGVGSIVGMMLAAGLFNLPFSKKALENKVLKVTLIFMSALLCIGYGVYLINENFLSF